MFARAKRVEGTSWKAPCIHQAMTPVFARACDLAGIPKTRRQWHKWNKGRGKAFTFKNEALRELAQ